MGLGKGKRGKPLGKGEFYVVSPSRQFGNRPYRPDYPLGLEEPLLVARDHFLDAVREKAPKAYGKVEDLAARILERLDTPAKEPVAALRAVVEVWKSFGRTINLPPWSRYVWCGANGRMIERAWSRSPERSDEYRALMHILPRPVAPRAWRRFARCWNWTYNLAHADNAWVAEWILYRRIVGERDPGPLPGEEFAERSRKQDLFDAIVPSKFPGPWRWISSGVGGTVARPPWWDPGNETETEYMRRVENYKDKVKRELKGRHDLQDVPLEFTLDRDLGALVRFHLLGRRLDEVKLRGERFNDTSKRLKEARKRIALEPERHRRRNDR